MKKISLIILIALLISCSDNKTSDNQNSSAINKDSVTVDIKSDFTALNDLMKKYEKPSQSFSVPSDRPSKVKGSKGTTIYVNPSDLTTINGRPLGKTIDIELKELLSTNDLLNSNAQTVSDGRLLVSGGAYFINMTSDGAQLKIKDGSNIKIEFSKISNENMTLFYGQKDSLGQMNWVSTESSFSSKREKQQQQLPQQQPAKVDSTKQTQMDALIGFLKSNNSSTLTEKEKEDIQKEIQLHQKIYDAINIKSFGWINCDRFQEIQDKTDLLVSIEQSSNVDYATFYLVFKDINSVMQSNYYKNNPNFKGGFQNIPVGYKVRLVGYTIKDKQILTYSEDISVKPKENLVIKLKPTTDSEFKILMTGT
jgi:hypothetical protein